MRTTAQERSNFVEANIFTYIGIPTFYIHLNGSTKQKQSKGCSNLRLLSRFTRFSTVSLSQLIWKHVLSIIYFTISSLDGGKIRKRFLDTRCVRVNYCNYKQCFCILKLSIFLVSYQVIQVNQLWCH